MAPHPRLTFAYGTRPEAIKLAPLIVAAREAGAPYDVVFSGQHQDIVDDVHATFEIVPTRSLALVRNGASLAQFFGDLVRGFGEAFAELRPEAVVVQGDTLSTFAAGLAAFLGGAPVAHVEAGLRSHDLAQPFPEEAVRRGLGQLARWHFPPTEAARENLRAEGVSGHVEVTGQTGMDALRLVARWTKPSDLLDRLAQCRAHGRLPLLVTCHRREAHGARLLALISALREVVSTEHGIEVFFVLHPNPAARDPVLRGLSEVERIHLIYPTPYVEFVAALANAELVLTDSGGVQEEAAQLGVATFVLRERSDRPESLASHASLVGSDAHDVVLAVTSELRTSTLRDKARAAKKSLFGDGHASTRILRRLWTDLAKMEKEPSQTPGP